MQEDARRVRGVNSLFLLMRRGVGERVARGEGGGGGGGITSSLKTKNRASPRHSLHLITKNKKSKLHEITKSS